MKLFLTALAGLTLASFTAAQSAVSHQNRKLVEAPGQIVETHASHAGQHVDHAQAGGTVIVEQAEPRPMLGVQLSPVQGAVAAQLPEYVEPAILLTNVYAGSPAEKAGLRVHDVIASVDGNGDVTIESLREALAARRPGDLVTLEVFRRGRSQMINVVIENFAPPVHQNLHMNTEVHLPGVEYWESYQGQHAWPRFGVAPDGGLMVQKDENGDWVATDSSVQDHKSLQYWLHSGNETLDLTLPEVDPDGNLRRKLDHLHSIYTDETGNLHLNQNNNELYQNHSEVLQRRIATLESKLDRMSQLLEKLIESSER